MKAPGLVALFWLLLLSLMWLAGCTPLLVRCEVAPSADEQVWQRAVVEKLYESEQRIERLEQWRAEQEAI